MHSLTVTNVMGMYIKKKKYKKQAHTNPCLTVIAQNEKKNSMLRYAQQALINKAK